jgi:molybdopterin/thiamine biosynthesis adenylyltransferase
MGLKFITVYDFDTVEEHNLASQFYGIKDIGKEKTKCLKEHLKEFTGTEIYTGEKYIDQPLFGIVIIAVDSMKERENISKQLLKSKDIMIVDGRMGGNTIEIFTTTDPNEYVNTLVKEGEVDPVPCSARYISYSSLICGGIITDQVKRLLNKEIIKKAILFDLDVIRTA